MGTAQLATPVEVQRIRLAGCPVDILSFEQALSELCRRIEDRIQTHVIFVNAAKAVNYQKDEKLRRAMERSHLLLADGMPIVWVSHMLGQALPCRVNGTDLMEAMVGAAESNGYSVYFLGGTDEVVEKTVQEFRRRHSRLRIAGYRNGYFRETQSPEIISEINRSGAQLLLVAISSPKKELWVDKYLPHLAVPVVQGVGGSFDVVAGVVSRAPVWMQRFGLEWFHRFFQEPRRMWRRYLKTNFLFVWLVTQSLVKRWTTHLLVRPE